VRYAQREALLAAMPPAHLAFLADMPFVHSCELPLGSQGAPLAAPLEDGTAVEPAARLLAVHAGLLPDVPVAEQLAALHARDASRSFVKQISDRGNVAPPPPELAQADTLLASGHHARLHVSAWRAIIDSGGGMPHRPITALVFPGRAHVASD
jgi:hypothetical protein